MATLSAGSRNTVGLNVSQLLEYSRRMRAGQQGADKSHKELREDGESLPLFNAVGTLLGPLGGIWGPKNLPDFISAPWGCRFLLFIPAQVLLTQCLCRVVTQTHCSPPLDSKSLYFRKSRKISFSTWVHFSSSNLWFLWTSGWMVILLKSTGNNNIKRLQKSRQT